MHFLSAVDLATLRSLSHCVHVASSLNLAAPRRSVAAALLAAAFTVACGPGGGDTVVQDTALETTGAVVKAATGVLAADMPGCDHVAVHVSEQVVYVVTDRACAGAGPRRVFSLGMRGGAAGNRNAVQLDMQEGEELDGITIPSLGMRRVGLYAAGQWRRIANTDSWQHRDGAGLLQLGGELYLLGGWIWGSVTNEVWKTRDLVNWQYLGDAPWPARHGAAWLVHDRRLWVIGGDLYDDVWSSPDGVRWTQEASAAPFGKRYTPNAASIDGRIVVYAGQSWNNGTWCDFVTPCTAEAPRDVWKSVDGRTWQLATRQAPWEGRGLIHGSAVHHGEIFLIGGGIKAVLPGETHSETIAEFSDIWSSRDGSNWTRRSEAYSFIPRTHFSVVSTPLGCYVSDGSVGSQAAVTNGLFFAADCVNYAPVPESPPLEPRHASSLIYFNGSLVILGGPPAGDAGTAVWQYFP